MFRPNRFLLPSAVRSPPPGAPNGGRRPSAVRPAIDEAPPRSKSRVARHPNRPRSFPVGAAWSAWPNQWPSTRDATPTARPPSPNAWLVSPTRPPGRRIRPTPSPDVRLRPVSRAQRPPAGRSPNSSSPVEAEPRPPHRRRPETRPRRHEATRSFDHPTARRSPRAARPRPAGHRSDPRSPARLPPVERSARSPAPWPVVKSENQPDSQANDPADD